MPAKTTEDRPETKGRPTLYKGIRMRSRLEADYAATLDRDGLTWEYEPFCFAADGVQWLPDFRITWPGFEVARYVEVKPAQFLCTESAQGILDKVDGILRQMSVAWESDPKALLVLALHRYGQRWPDFEVCGTPDGPWMCADNLSPNSMFLLWPGMGQKAALPLAPESARARRTASAR